MSSNPFAPPKAEVADVVQTLAQPLWNPNAAANWSLLFTPAFGAYLHMKNWQTLGEPGKARVSRAWVIVTLVLIIGLTSAAILRPAWNPLAVLTRPLGFVLLLGWYFTGARAQASYVKTHYGNEYPRRSWMAPLGIAVLAMVVYYGYIGFLAVILRGM